jgi:hypothetical protein
VKRRLHRCQEAGAKQNSFRAERQRGDQAAPVGKAPSCEDRNRRDRIDDHWDERHAGHPANMTAALGTLRNDDIGAGLRGT